MYNGTVSDKGEMMAEILISEQALDLINQLLNKLLWPETLKGNHHYNIREDNPADETKSRELSVICSNGDIAIMTTGKMGCGFRFPGGGGGLRPLVWMALAILAEAIRLDSGEEKIDPRKEYNDQIKLIHQLLDSVPWLETLNDSDAYAVQADNTFLDGRSDGWLAVIFRRSEERTLLEVNGQILHFYGKAKGGQSPRVYKALYILAEAIRLDTKDELC